MKKIYINPEMEIVKIASQTQILTGSDQQMGQKGSYSGSGGINLGGRDNDGDDW